MSITILTFSNIITKIANFINSIKNASYQFIVTENIFDLKKCIENKRIMNYQGLIDKYDTLCDTKKNLQSEKKHNMNDKKVKHQTIKDQKYELQRFIDNQKEEFKKKQLESQGQTQVQARQQDQDQDQDQEQIVKKSPAPKIRFVIKDQQKLDEIKQNKLKWRTLRNDIKQLNIRNKQIQVELYQVNIEIREIKLQMKNAKLSLRTGIKQMKVDRNKPIIVEYRQILKLMKQVIDKYSNRQIQNKKHKQSKQDQCQQNDPKDQLKEHLQQDQSRQDNLKDQLKEHLKDQLGYNDITEIAIIDTQIVQ